MEAFILILFTVVISAFAVIAVLRSLNTISADFAFCTMAMILINAIFILPESIDLTGKIAVTTICLTIYFLTLFYLFRKKNDALSISSVPNMVGKKLIATETITSFSEGTAKIDNEEWRCITVDGSVVICNEAIEVVEQDASLLKVKRIS